MYVVMLEADQILLPADRLAGKKDPHTKIFKIMHPTVVAFDLFDPAVKAFAEGIGFPVFPAIQNPFAETPDAPGGEVLELWKTNTG